MPNRSTMSGVTVIPTRGVDCGFDCEKDGVQASAARAAFRNRSRGRISAVGLGLGRAYVERKLEPAGAVQVQP